MRGHMDVPERACAGFLPLGAFRKDIKKPRQTLLSLAGFWDISLAMTYSHMGPPTLPSALRRFTSEFEKGSGGSILLCSPSNSVCRADRINTAMFGMSCLLFLTAFR